MSALRRAYRLPFDELFQTDRALLRLLVAASSFRLFVSSLWHPLHFFLSQRPFKSVVKLLHVFVLKFLLLRETLHYGPVENQMNLVLLTPLTCATLRHDLPKNYLHFRFHCFPHLKLPTCIPPCAHKITLTLSSLPKPACGNFTSSSFGLQYKFAMELCYSSTCGKSNNGPFKFLCCSS